MTGNDVDPLISSNKLRASVTMMEFSRESQPVAPALICLMQVSSEICSGRSFGQIIILLSNPMNRPLPESNELGKDKSIDASRTYATVL